MNDENSDGVKVSNSETLPTEEKSSNLDNIRIAFDEYSRIELLMLWGVVFAFLITYSALHFLSISYGSLLHAKVMYCLFVGFNIFGALMAVHAVLNTPSKSKIKTSVIWFTCSIMCAATGNFLDLIFWMTGVIAFKQSILLNMVFLVGIFCCFPAIKLLGSICNVEFRKQPILYFILITGSFLIIPLVMNPHHMSMISFKTNYKEFCFGIIYTLMLGYFASFAMHLWNKVQGRLAYAARLVSLSLFLMSLGCAIYAGLFSKMSLDSIPSNPVHIIIALSYVLSGLAIQRVHRTIETAFSIQDSKMASAEPLIEIFGTHKGLELYSSLEKTIKDKEAALIKSEIEKNVKQEMIVGLEEEVKKRKEAEKALVAANLAKSMFLAMMSHELRTPLTSIKGYGLLLHNSDSMQSEKLIAEVRAIGKNITDSSTHLQDMIEAILRFSQLESGNFGFNIKEFSFSNIRTYLDIVFKEKVKSSQATFETIYPDDNLMFKADQLSLQNIIVNPVVNAFKFCKDGKITLTVKAIKSDLMVEVEDSGIGLSIDQQKEIFEPFFQVSSGNKRKYGGSGLGLSIVKMLVDELNGTIEISSELKKGTTITLNLPNIVIQS